MEDILYESAIACSKLLNTVYKIKLGKKCKLHELSVYFTEDNFFHLAGLQHLKDVSNTNTSKALVFEDILQKRFTFKDIQNSTFLHSMGVYERILNLKYLETMFDTSSNLIFIVRENELKKSTTIKADYFFQYKDNLSSAFYIFLCKELKIQDDIKCKCVTFFKEMDKDYTKGGSIATLLSCIKILDYGKLEETQILLYGNCSDKSPRVNRDDELDITLSI